MSEPRTLVIKPERFGSGGGTYPVDPIAGSTSSEPRSLVVGNERMTPAQNIEVGVANVPTRLIGGDAITIGQEGFDYSVNLDIKKLSPVEGPASPTQWVAIWTEGSGTDEIRRIPTQAIPNDAPQDGVVYGRYNGQWVDVTEYVTIDWSDINNLPTEFPPAPHTHPWGEVTGKPSTFPPDPHQHPISDVTNLQAQLNAKEPTIAPGDPALFWAGDKTWKATPGLDTAAGDLRYVLKIGDTMTGSLLLPNGTNSLPALAFSGDPDTGIYSGGGNVLRIATGGTQRVSVGQTGIDFSIPLREADGSQTAPSLTFSNDADTGIYRVGTDQLGFTTGGVLKLTLSTTALTSTLPIVLPIAAPTADAQAANKKYVDDKIAGAASATSIADTAPGTPTQGQLWWQSNTGVFSISYNDGNTTQWVQVNGAGIPEAPVDGKGWLRRNNGWSLGLTKTDGDAAYVAKTGDTMTGPLKIGTFTTATGLYPAALMSAGAYLASGALIMNGYYDAAAALKAVNAGRVMQATFDASVGQILFQVGSSVAAGAAAGTMNNAFTYVQSTGAFTLYGNILNTAGGLLLQAGGVTWVQMAATGGVVINTPTGANHGLHATCGPAASSAGVIGFYNGQTIYGAFGYNISAQTWGVYTNTSGYAPAGSWQSSDGILKAETGPLDPAAALANVMAIPVKSYTPANASAARMMSAKGDEPLCGWFAQDIETFIPEAVMDVEVPDHDLLQRSAIAGVEMPEQDTPAAKAMSEGDVTVKAINLYPLVAQLWAAVQAVKTENDKLHDRIKVLEGAV